VREVIVKPQSTVEYTSVASVSIVDYGLTNLIHDRCSSDVQWLCLTGLHAIRMYFVHTVVCSCMAGCVHSSVNKPGANGTLGYETLTHSCLYSRDREKK